MTVFHSLVKVYGVAQTAGVAGSAKTNKQNRSAELQLSVVNMHRQRRFAPNWSSALRRPRVAFARGTVVSRRSQSVFRERRLLRAIDLDTRRKLLSTTPPGNAKAQASKRDPVRCSREGGDGWRSVRFSRGSSSVLLTASGAVFRGNQPKCPWHPVGGQS